IFSKESLVRFFPKINLPDNKQADVETWIDFCTELKGQFTRYVEKSANILGSGGNNSQDMHVSEKNLIDAINYEKNLLTFLEDLRINKENWLVTNIIKNEIDNKPSRIKLEPLVVSSYFTDIFDKGSTSLLMSATILSKENLCKAV